MPKYMIGQILHGITKAILQILNDSTKPILNTYISTIRETENIGIISKYYQLIDYQYYCDKSF